MDLSLLDWCQKEIGHKQKLQIDFFPSPPSSRFASKPQKRLKTYRAHFLPSSSSPSLCLSQASSCVVVYSICTPYDGRLHTQVCECVLRMVNWCWMHTIVAARIKEEERARKKRRLGDLRQKRKKKNYSKTRLTVNAASSSSFCAIKLHFIRIKSRSSWNWTVAMWYSHKSFPHYRRLNSLCDICALVAAPMAAHIMTRAICSRCASVCVCDRVPHNRTRRKRDPEIVHRFKTN